MVGKSPVLFLLLAAVGVALAALILWRGGLGLRPGEPRSSAQGPGDRPRWFRVDAWLTDAVHFYRDLGFMNEHAGKSEAEVIEAVRARLERDWGDQLATAGPHSLELFLLESMPSRIWWADTEADVAMGNRVYEQILPEWSRISVGAFEPRDIVETWAGEEGPVALAFTLNGQPVELHPKVADDWLDMDNVREINRLIAPSGRRFEVYFPDQSAVLMCLTPEETRRLERERGWKFLPQYHP